MHLLLSKKWMLCFLTPTLLLLLYDDRNMLLCLQTLLHQACVKAFCRESGNSGFLMLHLNL